MGSENYRVSTIVEMAFIYARMSIWPTQCMMVIIFVKVQSLLFKLSIQFVKVIVLYLRSDIYMITIELLFA